jgi:diguanylate cyclase (GGDEF)-like protein
MAQLVERTPLTELGALPLSRIGAEAPALIATIVGALSDPARGPAELARAAGDLESLFSEKTIAAPAARRETPRQRMEPQTRTGQGGSGELDRCLAALLAEQRRYGHPFSLALVDVDGLARINDAYGRDAGDRMLSAVEGVLRRELRDVDHVFRVEDDEFAVIAPHTDAERLAPMATRVANLIASSQAPEGPRIAIAAGVVGCPDDGLGADRLLESATEAVYAAKASGAAVARSPNGSEGVLQDS